MPQDYLSFLDRMAAEYGVPREEARAIYELETNSGRNVRGSSAGAQGHMQLMPATARELGVQNIADPYQNIRGGVKYYAQQRKAFRDPALAAAAYNAGPGRPRTWRNGPVLDAAIWAENVPFSETRDYVKKVLSNTMNYAAILSGQPQSLKRQLGVVGPRSAEAPPVKQLP